MLRAKFYSSGFHTWQTACACSGTPETCSTFCFDPLIHHYSDENTIIAHIFTHLFTNYVSGITAGVQGGKCSFFTERFLLYKRERPKKKAGKSINWKNNERSGYFIFKVGTYYRNKELRDRAPFQKEHKYLLTNELIPTLWYSRQMYFFPMKKTLTWHLAGHGQWHQDQLLFQRSLWATARRKKAHSVPAMCLVRPANQKLLGAAGRPGAKSKVDAYQASLQPDCENRMASKSWRNEGEGQKWRPWRGKVRRINWKNWRINRKECPMNEGRKEVQMNTLASRK